jgi:nucleoside-diphosphate-sugar epimerase
LEYGSQAVIELRRRPWWFFRRVWLSMRLDLKGRVAVVLGGSSGLGHAIALSLAQAGADVVASSRRHEQVESVAAEIESLGSKTLRIPSDVTDRASIQSLHDQALQHFGKVDILVNAAGITLKKPAIELEEADWQRVFNTNLTGTLRSSTSLHSPPSSAFTGSPRTPPAKPPLPPSPAVSPSNWRAKESPSTPSHQEYFPRR